uniref:Peptidase M12B propeptide domain-containing protein n=1 Tax=Astyanax mexicanus TaxID=7994 RepID=W5LEQ3_ASTMX
MLALQCLLFAVVAGRISSSSSTGQWEHITHPKRLLQQKLSTEETPHSSLDTRARESGRETPLHLAQSTFQIEAFGSTYILDLQLNHDLLSSDYVERHFDKEGKPSQTAGGEHCYYHGSLRGNPRSWAALATCQGLHGMFSDGVFSYIIEPLINKTDQIVDAHLVKKIPDIKLTTSCTDCTPDEDPEEDLQSDSEQTEGLKRTKRRVRKNPSSTSSQVTSL